jgi:hypothetical protein
MRIVRGSASLRVDHQGRESVGCSGLHFNNIRPTGKYARDVGLRTMHTCVSLFYSYLSLLRIRKNSSRRSMMASFMQDRTLCLHGL